MNTKMLSKICTIITDKNLPIADTEYVCQFFTNERLEQLDDIIKTNGHIHAFVSLKI